MCGIAPSIFMDEHTRFRLEEKCISDVLHKIYRSLNICFVQWWSIKQQNLKIMCQCNKKYTHKLTTRKPVQELVKNFYVLRAPFLQLFTLVDPRMLCKSKLSVSKLSLSRLHLKSIASLYLRLNSELSKYFFCTRTGFTPP